MSRRELMAKLGAAGAGLAGLRVAPSWADSGPVPKAALPAPTALMLGSLLPLSGPQALGGDECLRGMELAVEDVNLAGGVAGMAVSLAVSDGYGQAQGRLAGQITRALMSDGHANVILGAGSSALSYSASAAAELAQMPYIELSAAADGITRRGFKYLLRTAHDTSMLAAVLTGAIAARFAGKKIGLLFDTGASSGAIAAAALAQWQQRKVAVLLSIGYPEASGDLHEPVSRLRQAGVEVLLHAGGADDVLAMFQAMGDMGWKPQAIFGAGSGYGLRETAFALGNAFDGSFVAAAPFYGPRSQYIAAAYMARFGMKPRAAESLTCYVGTKLLLDRLNQIGGDPAKLLDGLRKIDLPAGTLANGWGVAFDKNGQNTRALPVLQQWRQGELQAV